MEKWRSDRYESQGCGRESTDATHSTRLRRHASVFSGPFGRRLEPFRLHWDDDDDDDAIVCWIRTK
jgi:hypothetical protein